MLLSTDTTDLYAYKSVTDTMRRRWTFSKKRCCVWHYTRAGLDEVFYLLHTVCRHSDIMLVDYASSKADNIFVKHQCDVPRSGMTSGLHAPDNTGCNRWYSAFSKLFAQTQILAWISLCKILLQCV